MQPATDNPMRLFRVRDFLEFGQEYGIDYRFHDQEVAQGGGTARDRESIIAEGRIDEISLPSGFRFTGSDLDLFHSYRSVSQGHAPLLIVIVLEGHIELSVGALTRELAWGQALSLQLRPELRLEATQRSGQHLRTLTLAFDPALMAQSGPLNASLISILQAIKNTVHAWTVPATLYPQLERCLYTSELELQRALVLEGLALQLIGYGLPEFAYHPPGKGGAGQRGYQRLEAVRQMLEFDPTQEYTLEGLAQHAAMSASSLRSKFRTAFGVSVFDYLRRCRLELGRRYLEQGFSVQQAAHKAGYRHATNFATAFRREFGLPPRGIR